MVLILLHFLIFYFYQYFVSFHFRRVYDKKITMPKIKNFRDLSRRQQNRRLVQTNNEKIEVPRKNRLISDTQNSSMYCSFEDNLNRVELLSTIPDIQTHIQSENNIIQDMHDIRIQPENNIIQDFVQNTTGKAKKVSLKERLHMWAIESNLAQKYLTTLLRILRDEGYNELPSDSRTFLKTPKKTLIYECGRGHYFHYGLKKALQDKLKYYTNINHINNIEINLNIDGLPLAKSSRSQLWPILGQIYNIGNTEPFLIGAYHGYQKLTDAQDLLHDFCEEYRVLHTEGFLFQNQRYFITIRAVICDAPAKSFVTGTKGHNAYFGCGKCFCEGDHLNHRMLFLNENALLRTDSNFRNRENDDHHVSLSPFQNLPDMDMITTFPLDYMHLICLGVMKKLLCLWIKSKQISRLRDTDIEGLSKDLVSLHKFIPIEFVRRPRSLNELDRWKATEFRMFLLYFGPIILQKYLDVDYLKHFCALHTAIRILCHPEDCLYNNTYAKDLLMFFVKTFKLLYGEDNIVYNVHNLIHLCEDVKKYGSLDTFSAFPFENYMQVLKKQLRKSEKPLSQINNRISEQITRSEINDEANTNTNVPLLLKPDRKNLPLQCVNSHKRIKLKNFTLTTKCADNCCYLKDGSVFCIEYIGIKDKTPVVLGKRFADLLPIPIYPHNSQNMDIHMTKNLTHLEVIPASEICKKAFKVFYNGDYYVIPLLHL